MSRHGPGIDASREQGSETGALWWESLRVAFECSLGSELSFVALTIHSRQFPQHRDFEDGNWLHATAEVRVGGMTADVRGEYVRAEELSEFLAELQQMYDRVEGDAHFSTLERWLELKVHCRPGGSLVVDGEVLDHHGVGNRLVFSLPDLDQTHLPELITGLQRATAAFPVVGHS